MLNILRNFKESKEKIMKFFKTHLIVCAKERNFRAFKILVLHIYTKEWALEKEDLKQIIHYKTNDINSLFSKTALNWANENNDSVMTLDLLMLEKEAHSSEKEGLACIRDNLTRDAMLPLITETYRNLYDEPKNKRLCRVFFKVVFELLLLSYMLFMFDIYSDINLTVSYYGFGYGNKTFDASEMTQCPGSQFNLSCYERTSMSRTRSFENSSYDTLDQTSGASYEKSFNLHQMFQAAFITTCLSTRISLVFYFYSIPVDQCLIALPRSLMRMLPRKVFLALHENKTLVQSILQVWINSPGTRRSDASTIICVTLPRISFLTKILLTLLVILGKLMWPIHHMLQRMKYLASLKSSEHSDRHSVCEETWANIKAVEYGVESSFQLLLQIWLLEPILSDISTWSNTEVVVRCVTGLANFLTFDTYPACYIEKALGKILLTIISLTLGVANMKCYKHGQGFTDKPRKIIFIFLNILAQTIARILAFKSLILLEAPLKYVIFFLVHFVFVFLETPLLKETLTAPSEACQSKRATLIKYFSWELFSFIFSGLSSTIVMIHFRQSHAVSHKFHVHFLSHTSFFILILIENLVLVTLPYMAPHLYPEVDCFTADSRSRTAWIVVVLWFVGVISQILHYKMAHDFGPLNVPQV
jgi:hypothetical protein